MSNEPETLLEKEREDDIKVELEWREGEPTSALKGVSWEALLIGVAAYFIGLFNATMELNEKGYYFAVLIFGLYAAVSLQKAVRDKEEGIPVTTKNHTVQTLRKSALYGIFYNM